MCPAHVPPAQVLADPLVKYVEPNCRIQLELPTLTADEAASTPEKGGGGARSDSGVQLGPPWGLDRIDSRSGTDNRYNYGTANGEGSVVYILDTGVRISHSDFGGRARGGWSAECPTVTVQRI